MNIDLSQSDLITLRDVLRQHVTDLGREINATDSLRYKHGLRDTEHQLERILGAVTGAIEPGAAPPRDWEARDSVPDIDKGRL